jgi:tetratricopeptide (TPR) repeat protein
MIVRSLILFVLCWQSSFLFAQTADERICDMPSKECLAWVEEALAHVQSHSMPWYNLKLKQLDSLMTVKEFKALKNEINAFQESDNLPPVFATYLKIYQAKVLMVEGHKEQAAQLSTLTVEQLQQLNQVFYSPIRMIMIANVMQDSQQYAQSLRLLEQTKTDFADSKDPYLKLELFGNLGHAYRLLQRFDEALLNYQQSLQFAIELGHEQQITTLYNHVGRMYQQTNQLEQAEQSFIQALHHAQLDGHDTTVIGAKINLAYFYAQQMATDKARLLMKDIDPVQIQPHQKKLWATIEKVLKTEQAVSAQ